MLTDRSDSIRNAHVEGNTLQRYRVVVPSQEGGDEGRANGGNRPVGFVIYLEKQDMHSSFLMRIIMEASTMASCNSPLYNQNVG